MIKLSNNIFIDNNNNFYHGLIKEINKNFFNISMLNFKQNCIVGNKSEISSITFFKKPSCNFTNTKLNLLKDFLEYSFLSEKEFNYLFTENNYKTLKHFEYYIDFIKDYNKDVAKKAYGFYVNNILSIKIKKDTEGNIIEEPLKVNPQYIAELFSILNDELISKETARNIITNHLINFDNELYDKYNCFHSEFTVWIFINEEDVVKSIGNIDDIIKVFLKSQSENIELYKNGKKNLFGFFVGEIVKNNKGINAKDVNKKLQELINK